MRRITEDKLDQIYHGDARRMGDLPDGSIQLVVTSPPYNVGRVYAEDASLDKRELADYLRFLSDVWTECYRVLCDGGRIAVNVANTGRTPYFHLSGAVAAQLTEIGFHLRGEIPWDKGASASHSAAWGTWASPTNPVLRDCHEYILIASKGSYRLPATRGPEGRIPRDQFLEYTKTPWHFQAARVPGHPAPFPLELPRRLILLYSHPEDIVLDPFMGSGTTACAALELGRRYVGYEISQTFVKLAETRIARHANHLALKGMQPYLMPDIKE